MITSAEGGHHARRRRRSEGAVGRTLTDDDRRQASSAPLTPIGSGWFRPLAVLLSLDRLYVLGARLVLIDMVLYSAFVVPRLRWVLLGALSTLTLLFFLWHFVAGLLRGRNKV